MTTTLENILPKVKQVALSFSNGDPCRGDDIFSQACLYIVGRGFENEKPAFILKQVAWQAYAYCDSEKAYNRRVDTIKANSVVDRAGDDIYDYTEVLADNSTSVEDQIAEREQAEAIAEAVEALDPKAQQMIRLLRQGHSFAEIAAKLDVSRSAVSQKMDTIRKYLALAVL